MPELTKDPSKVRAGQIAARARWGPKRVLRLDTLPTPIREAISAMVAAEANARAREAEKAADDAA